MLAIGRALMSHPRMLVLDEPSMGLSPILVTSILTVLLRLRDRGLSILLVEPPRPARGIRGLSFRDSYDPPADIGQAAATPPPNFSGWIGDVPADGRSAKNLLLGAYTRRWDQQTRASPGEVYEISRCWAS